MTNRIGPLLLVASILCSWPAIAADIMQKDGPPEPAAIDLAGKGIWGAIAFSDVNGKRGIFWGAATRSEADLTALNYCQSAGGIACSVVITFRNHQYRNDRDDSGFPYEHCAALATLKEYAKQSKWGAVSGATKMIAQTGALQKCGDARCTIAEWVCT
ncbi:MULTISPECIES: DUF4189 domain-containing protein [Phyllobacterium]|jgi:Domain of unknown function (DUF4189)|uniref:DUF4189 domain-containing protein n=1 Tax=Phyllobacterium TaxID=28100 RepID=UPI001CC142F2|nr:DUF4189 domain-containing protein [Phyllobacterium calauticae]MBZ3695500.1 DUF4189 domain-containing protein [Phyllobacterium calauticae]